MKTLNSILNVFIVLGGFSSLVMFILVASEYYLRRNQKKKYEGHIFFVWERYYFIPKNLKWMFNSDVNISSDAFNDLLKELSTNTKTAEEFAAQSDSIVERFRWTWQSCELSEDELENTSWFREMSDRELERALWRTNNS